MTICVRRPSDNDIRIISDDTTRDEFLSDRLSVVGQSPDQYLQVTHQL